MTYQRFEDLPVWNAAQDLAVDVFAMVNDRAFNHKGDLRDQLQRASLSISNNIAEGFERGSTAELLCYLYIARGSAGETRSALRFAARLADRGLLPSPTSNLKSQISDLLPRSESISRQLRAWADHLQNSDIKGPRHLTDASRAADAQVTRTRAFMDKLRRIQAREPVDHADAEPTSEI
nr:S23 ribosomal protein [uncultured bacterium]